MSTLPEEKKAFRIHVLPDELANQIAAGEVVERPMSVVKELVENAVDAEAGRILVEVEGGGKTLIRVTDNGTGMSREDAQRAFDRHATSKITHQGDLERIQSLGFRGEALPSIASVARVRLSTAGDEREGGTRVVVEGGTDLKVEDTARPRGTTVEVAQLFFNTPARKKFLKTDTTEFSHITQVVTQQALARPGIHFTLTHNGRKVIDTLPTDQLLYRVAELFGADLARELVQVDAQAGDYRLKGFLSSPVYTRSSRSAQYCYINGRFVRDKVILHSTQQGYSHLLPKGQHPVIFLYLSMDPTLYDVNVHPAKAEVRFAYQQEVHRFVCDAVRSALSRSEKLPLDKPENRPQHVPSAASQAQGAGRTIPVHGSPGSLTHADAAYTRERHGDLSNALQLLYKTPKDSAARFAGSPAADSGISSFDRKPMPVSNLMYSEFEPLGQLGNSFIVMQGERGILIVDQHIAHERVLYERFREAAKNKRVEVQNLLFPLALEFSPGEAELLNTFLDRLKELGLELEPFGQNEFLLRSVPAMLKDNDHSQIMREIVDMLPKQQHEEVLKEKFEEILIMMSCRNAIKVNMPLDMDRIRKLIGDLEQTEMPYTCPHGRPIALLFEMDDILRKFLRK